MKLRNKKTGKIVERLDITIREEGVVFNNDELYHSLAELNAEWEDAPEEPSEIYFISNNGQIHEEAGHDRYREERKAIGNYFETKEEAEKAVEKLKAWKRLKEAGYHFKPDAIEEGSKHYYILRLGCEQEKIMKPVSECRSNFRDLKILFGGEE